MTGFVKEDICRQVSVCLRVFCGILFALKPFRDYSLCSVSILPQSAFYTQSAFYPWSAVRSLRFTLTVFKTDQSMRRCFGWVIQPRKRRFCWIFRYILNSMVKKSTLLKGNLCNYKCFIDTLISTFFVQWLQNAPRFWDRFCAEFCYVLCRFYLRWWIHDPDNLTLIGKNFRITPALIMHSVSLIMHPPYCLLRQWWIPQSIAYLHR